MPVQIGKTALEELYLRYNRREWVYPDPVGFLYDYEIPLDREVVGLVASSLAYGRVAQIHKSISVVLARMGPSPHEFLLGSRRDELCRVFRDFKHRFTTGEELCALLAAIRQILRGCGSLEACFAAGFRAGDTNVLSALSAFVEKLQSSMQARASMFVPAPCAGSACKRLHLFLRWMVRRDQVDPGGWNSIPASHLIVPVDTHMHRIGVMLGFTTRRQADLKAALEITEAFKAITPEDPIRYDFALTRAGILDNEEIKGFLDRFAVGAVPQKMKLSRTTTNIATG